MGNLNDAVAGAIASAQNLKTFDVSDPWCFHIEEAAKRAVEMTEDGSLVWFSFNDTKAVARPGDTPEQVVDLWSSCMKEASEEYRASPEYKKAQQDREDQYKAECAAHMTEAASSEAELREAQGPWPKTIEQVAEYINSLIDRQHDYGTCVYAMSLAATAAYNYVSHKLGVTGFQASCADLDFVRRSRQIKGPFMLIKGEDALYPQYDLHGKLSEALAEWEPWLREQAVKNLAESPEAHPNVLAHWKKLAGQTEGEKK